MSEVNQGSATLIVSTYESVFPHDDGGKKKGGESDRSGSERRRKGGRESAKESLSKRERERKEARYRELQQ